MIKIGGDKIRTVPEQVAKNSRDIEDFKKREFIDKNDVIDNLSSYQEKKPLSANQGRILKDMFNSAISGVFIYKGSVATVANLPSSGNKIGDTYNVLDTGENYTWDGEAWDKLSGIVDVSNCVTLDTNQTITGVKTFDKDLGQDFMTFANGNNIFGRLANSNNNLSIQSSGKSINMYLDAIITTGRIRPNNNNRDDLGQSNARYKDLYLSGTAYASQMTLNTNAENETPWYISKGLNQINIQSGATPATLYTLQNSTFYPSTNSKDLGRVGNYWKNLYLSGNISDGTNSITVADLAAGLAQPTITVETIPLGDLILHFPKNIIATNISLNWSLGQAQEQGIIIWKKTNTTTGAIEYGINAPYHLTVHLGDDNADTYIKIINDEAGESSFENIEIDGFAYERSLGLVIDYTV